jgi:hypothetical protein
MNYIFNLTLQEAQIIFNSLQLRPYNEVIWVINTLTSQANEQDKNRKSEEVKDKKKEIINN